MWVLLALAGCCDCGFHGKGWKQSCALLADVDGDGTSEAVEMIAEPALDEATPAAEGGWTIAFGSSVGGVSASAGVELLNHATASVRVLGWFGLADSEEPRVDVVVRGAVAGRPGEMQVFDLAVDLAAAESADLAWRFERDAGEAGDTGDTGDEPVDVRLSVDLLAEDCARLEDASVTTW